MRQLPRILVAVAFVVASSLIALAASVGIEDFRGYSDHSDITISWRTSLEDGVAEFAVERSITTSDQFERVGTVLAQGSNSSYEFVDKDAYLKGDTEIAGTVYRYRLVAEDRQSATVYTTDPIAVTHTVSSVRRTWGVIKQMFR